MKGFLPISEPEDILKVTTHLQEADVAVTIFFL